MSGLIKAFSATLLLMLLLMLTACGGGADTSATADGSLDLGGGRYIATFGGTANTDEIDAFKTTVYHFLGQDGSEDGDTRRCGACHSPTASDPAVPFFVHRGNVNTAWAEIQSWNAANGQLLIDLTNPDNSYLITQVLNNHNCWTTNLATCANDIRNQIVNMARALSDSGADGNPELNLSAPADHEVTTTFIDWPETAPPSFNTLHTLLSTHCSSCHVPNAPQQQGSPFFGVSEMQVAYDELIDNDKIVLSTVPGERESSRIIVRPRDQSHGCWDTDGDDQPDCTESVNAIRAAITEYVDAVAAASAPADPNDPTIGTLLENLVISKALTKADALATSSGSRYEAAQIALFDFSTGSGNIVYDRSGRGDPMDLTLGGAEGTDYRWLGNFGVEFLSTQGKADAGASATDLKFAPLIAQGQYSLEAWLIPNNVAQDDAYVLSYSGGAADDRNFTLTQNMYNYTFYNRNSATGIDGDGMMTPDTPETAQTALQHIVVTYSSTEGRKLYVNGRYRDDVIDPSQAGDLVDWDRAYSFVIGNDTSQNRGWQGTFRLVAVHNRALNAEQIRTNFDRGVGDKYVLLFPLRERDTNRTDGNTDEPMLPGIPDSCHIMVGFEQYDAFSYLFHTPTFICLDQNLTATDLAGIRIKGVWLGQNGDIPRVGQAFQSLDVTINESYTPQTGQVLSEVGTIIELQNGPDATPNADEFFLAFEFLGTTTDNSSSTANLDPAVDPASVQPRQNPAAFSDIGLRTFDEINATFSHLTGIPETNTTVNATFEQYRQQFPSVETIGGFVPSHQMATAQLALAYCDELVSGDIATDGTSRALFGSGFDYNTDIAYQGSAATRSTIVNKFVTDFMNLGATPLSTQPDSADVINHLTDTAQVDLNDPVNGSYGSFDSMIDSMLMCRNQTADTSCNSGDLTCCTQERIDSQNAPGRTAKIVTATCGAVLGSAISLIQ